jgi:MoaA/NifB/PqqE/SkfB family radical SAM enzyme
MTSPAGTLADAGERDRSTAGPGRESAWQWLKHTSRTGGPGQCIFAVNNACNASCQFCNFALDKLPRGDWSFAPTRDAKDAIDVLHRLFIRYLIVTGGEPMLHPDLDEILAHASARGMSVLLVTNGSRLVESRCRELAACGVSNVVVSIDAPTVEAHEHHRKLPRVCEKIRTANALFRELGVQVTASVTMSRLVTDYPALIGFLEELGFPCVTFSYPLTDLPSSFLGYADSSLVDFSPEELHAHFEQVKTLKDLFPILNPTASLEDMQRLVRKEPQRFECLGGYRYFYLDWNLMVWRCHHWDAPMCSIAELDESRYVRDGCTKCMIDCFRDSSVMQHVGVNVADAIRDVRGGRLLRAAGRVLRRSNLTSLRSALENRRWIRHL